MKIFLLPFVILFLACFSIQTKASSSQLVTDPDLFNYTYQGPAGSWLGGDTTMITGDLNQDGIDDLVLNSFESGGGIYVIFGKKVDLSGNISLTDPLNFNLKLTGCNLEYKSLIIGDINKDNKADLLLGCNNVDYLYVLFSQKFVDLGSTTGNIASISDSNVYNARFKGIYFGYQHRSMLDLADIDGDSFEDLIQVNIFSNEVYITTADFFASLVNTTGNSYLLSDSSSYNLKLIGTQFTESGFVAGQVDSFNGDDLVFESYCDSSSKGKVKVLFSSLITSLISTPGQTVNVDLANNYNLEFTGANNSDLLGCSSTSVKIANVLGDAKNELIIGASANSEYYNRGGVVYIFSGEKLATFNSTLGNNVEPGTSIDYALRIYGGYTNELMGGINTLQIADLDNDNYLDLILISNHSNSNGVSMAGSVYYLSSQILRAEANPLLKSLYLDQPTDYTFRLDGTNNTDYLGWLGLESAMFFDFDANHKNDLLTGSFLFDSNGSNSGSLFLLYNSRFANLPAQNNLIDNVYDLEIYGNTNSTFMNWGSIANADLNSDGIKDMIIAASFDNKLYIKYGGSLIKNLTSGLQVLESVNLTNSQQVRLGGEHILQIRFDDSPLTDFAVSFENNQVYDWSQLSGNVDLLNGKSVIYGTLGLPGTIGTHNIYIPKLETSNAVIICHQATDITQVVEDCPDAQIIKQGDPGLSIVQVNNKEYWKVNDQDGTGGMSYHIASTLVLSPTGTNLYYSILLSTVAIIVLFYKTHLKQRFMVS